MVKWSRLVRPGRSQVIVRWVCSGMRKGTASWLARLRRSDVWSVFCRGSISQDLNPTWRGLDYGLLVKRGLFAISGVVKYFETLLTCHYNSGNNIMCCMFCLLTEKCFRRYVASCDLAACRCELPPKFCTIEKNGHV